jgi:hypothetical protein
MLRLAGSDLTSRRWGWLATLLLALASWLGHAQDVSVVRLPQSTDMTVRLENMATHISYDRTGDAYFIVPTGRYSVQLLREGQIAYQEVEFIGPDSPQTRTINPQAMEIVIGLPEGNPTFDPNLCSALETASRLAIARYGLHDADVQRRLANADFGGTAERCGQRGGVDALAEILVGSYGVTPLGMLGVTIQVMPLSGDTPRPRNRGNSPIYNDPATQRLAIPQQHGSNVTPNVVGDLKSGISDVAVDLTGKPLVVCAAINSFTPLFCDSNGFAIATPAIANLRALYRFSVKTTPVDSHGVEEDQWTSFVSEAEYHATQQKLEDALAAIAANLQQRIAHVEANSVTVPSAHNPGQTVKYFATADVVALIAATQEEIDAALRDSTLQPLRRHFPQALASVDPEQHTVPHNEAEKIFGELQNAVTLLTKISGELGVDFIFRTAPVETEGTRLTFDACGWCTPMLSQGGQHRFYRGKYYVKATLDGYIPYEGWLDLVEDPKTILECDMVRLHRASNGRGSVCSLRAQ